METFETIKEKIPGWDKARLFLKCVVIFLIAMLTSIPTRDMLIRWQNTCLKLLRKLLRSQAAINQNTTLC